MSEQKRVPELRFPEFDGKLESKTLGDFMSFKNGINADKGQYGHGRKFINVLDIIAKKPIYHDKIIGSVSVSDKEFEKNEVKYGDILFQRSSETREEAGQSNIYLDKHNTATFGGFVIRGRPTVKFSPLYFDALLKTSTLRKEITTKSGGSTRFNVGQDSLSAVNVTLTTDFEEQQKIANFLSSVDTKLAKLGRKKAHLEDYKRGLMQQIFSLKLRFKQDDGSEFPKWEIKTLKDLAYRQTNKNVDGSVTDVFTNSATRGIVRQQDYFDKNIANADNLEGYYIVQSGDYIYNPRISVHAPVGPIGKNYLGLGVMSPLYSVFRFYQDDDRFYEFYFNSSMWHRYMKMVANYGARHDRMNIITEDFLAMPLPVPDYAEQKKIADLLSTFDQKIEVVGKQIEQLEAFKKGLLQKLFV
ncbi:restriction endonuclease subunit S [Salinimonas sediminis]|uniref:Restriction endonuclease subunit S n=1 Tax=Salinimonas sediminis TaxID=2303538 RepID=A0A346NHB3_9ALTE|nr:restriction endonuclease subunit S [Salinimonas sediminis]AXR04920.1 restriction endonuclease subunit S [Salinimonas sediminis]